MVKPLQVKPLPNYNLLVNFETNEQKVFDLKPYFEFKFYLPLKDEKLFKSVFIEDSHVQWATGQDISPHELYENSKNLDLNGTEESELQIEKIQYSDLSQRRKASTASYEKSL